MVTMEKIPPLIPFLPFLAFVITIFGGKRLPGKGAYIPILLLSLSTLLSFHLLFSLYPFFPQHSLELDIPWISSERYKVTVGYRIDALSLSMLCMVSFVSLLIHIYSIGYMKGDKRYHLFFAYLPLFTASMLTLVLSNSLLLLYMGWELVGLCSYLLIGFWYERPPACRAAIKAFITTRVGDMGFFIGILYIFLRVHSTSYGDLEAMLPQLGDKFALTASLLLFWGAVGKSAQFPLHVWLPDAMEGPTPVSALIHAATMVAAGPYMVARLFPLFSVNEISLSVVAGIGAITMLMAGLLALAQNDIKRVLAYSTMSQLGYMMMGLGMGSVFAGAFHLLSHAFFKALLFLGAGCIIHALETNDIWEMGGLFKKFPITAITFLVGTLALAGIPPLCGYYSKEAILSVSFHRDFTFFTLGLFGAFLTALYMGRAYMVAFLRPASNTPHQEHELGEPPVMTVPLVIFSLCVLLFGTTEEFFLHTLGGKMEEIPFALLPLLFPLAGFLSAYLLYGIAWDKERMMEALRPFHALLVRRLYIDDAYNLVFVRSTLALARLFARFDLEGVDGVVNALGRGTVVFSYIQGWIDKYVVDGVVNAIAWLTGASGFVFRYLQEGTVQFYLLLALIGLLLVFIL